MNDFEKDKLRKELTRKNELLKEQREDQKDTEKQLIVASAERDSLRGELVIARRTIQNIDLIIEQNVKQMKSRLEQENSQSLNQLQSYKMKLQDEKLLNQKLQQQTKTKDSVISELSLRLKQMSRKYKDPSLLINTKEITQQVVITNNQFYKLTDKYNKLCQDMDNVMAENKILRKLHGVPENFGFDLEDIKMAEKQELEDYKAQCRKLESEIEELQGQRTQLRYRLRQYNTLFSTKGERYKEMNTQQLDMLDQYAMNLKEGRVDLPQIDKTQKELEREVLKLRAQVEVLQNKGTGSSIGGKKQQQKLSGQTLKKFESQLKDVLDPLVKDLKKITQNSSTVKIVNNHETSHVQNYMNQSQFNSNKENPFQPPLPLPISHNDYSQIKDGYSYIFASKIPINMKDYSNELQFNIVKAKYDIAALQLQNIESLKLLKQKEKVEGKLWQEVDELKNKYERCLKVQDGLFMKYFQEKEQTGDRVKKLEIQKANIFHEKQQIEASNAILSDAYNALNKKTEVQQKMSEYASKLAINEADNLKLKRKYEVLYDQHKMLAQSYTKLQTKSLSIETSLKEKLAYTKKYEKQLTFYINKILDENKNSVSADVHNILLSKSQMLNDKMLNQNMKQTQLRLRINKLENIERQITTKDEIIETLRDDNLDIGLEVEIMRNRLENVDPDYRNFRKVFEKLVGFINQNNVSLLSYFKKFDKDNSGTLDKNQFISVLKIMGFEISNDEFDLLFNEFDLDGSQSLTYNEFLRKMRRSGVMTRSKEEQSLFRLFKAIKQANISVKKAFQIIDIDGSNQISKNQMDTAFRKIGIECGHQTIQYIFKTCDTDMSGQISCQQFEKLFEDIVRQSMIEQKEIFAEELDWKYLFVLKIEEISNKYHSGLQQTFKSIDTDKSSTLSMNEFKQLFENAGIGIQRKQFLELFEFLDRQRDGKVEYIEFLKVLEEAKRQKKRVDRIKYIKQRTTQLKKENQVANNGQKFKISEQSSLKIRLMSLETKHGSLNKKNEKLIKTIVTKEQQIMDMNKQIEEFEKNNSKIQDQYYREKEQKIFLEQKLKNMISEVDSKKLMQNNKEMSVKSLELTTNLQLYKNLYSDISDKNKKDELIIGKIESLNNKYFDIVKDLQSTSQINEKYGKIIIQLELSKRNEEVVNRKYDQIIEELRKNDQQYQKVTDQSIDKERQIINTHMFMQEKTQLMQRTIDNLTMKINPTVNTSKVEQILFKIRQISNAKTSLEKQNKQLRQLNFNIQVRNDYIENERHHIEELQKKLRRTYTDQSSITIMDLTKKLSEYRMSELKAKRESGLLKEKEEYYMRVHNTQTENIKELEEELSKWEVKFNQREQMWRQRIAGQLKMMEDIQKQATKAKEQQRNANAFFQKRQADDYKISQKYQSLPQEKQQKISSMIRPRGIASETQNVIELKNKINELEEELISKQREIYQYKSTMKQLIPEVRMNEFGSQIAASTNSFVMQTQLTSSQLRGNARKFLNNQKEQQNYYKQEATRLTQAAQHSIDTLQRIIDDKNEQLRRKDQMIENLKKELLKNKEQDTKQIQILSQELRQLRTKTEISPLNDFMSRPTNKNFYPGSKGQDVELLKEAVRSKDEQIKLLHERYDKLYINKDKKGVNENATYQKKVERKMVELQDERQYEKKKHQQNEEQLKIKIRNLERLSKDKDQKLTKLQKTLMDLKNYAVNQAQFMENSDLEEGIKDAISNMNKGKNANDSKMEIMLQNSLNKIQELTKKNKQYEYQVKRMKQQKFSKTTNMMKK